MHFLRKFDIFHIVLFICLELFGPCLSYNFTCQSEELEKEIGANNFNDHPWPNGIVHYELHSSLTNDDRGQVYRAFDEFHGKTCIRFAPRNGAAAYVSIENDPTTCGLAHVCRLGGYQFAKFGGGCKTASVMVHELGHTLCYRHEQDRPDKAQYISTPCNRNEILPQNQTILEKSFVQNWSTAGESQLKNGNTLDIQYDYTSAMHYGCDSCLVPTKPGVSKNDCGNKSPTDLLSVLDVEKINIFYNCPGCMSYRYKPTNKINGDKMVIGGHSLNGEVQYICRALHNGDIIPGTGLRSGTNPCYVAYYGLEYAYHGSSELLTNPQGVNIVWRRIGDFGNKIPANAVKGGRTKYGNPLYVGRCTFETDGKTALQVGKIDTNEPDRVYISYYGKEIRCVGNFEILVCEDPKPVRFVSYADNLVLEATNGVSEGKQAMVWDKINTKWQQWIVNGLNSPSDIQSIVGKAVTIKNLDQDGGSIKVLDEDVRFSKVVVWGDGTNGNQKWIFKNAQNMAYHIVNLATNRCLYNNGRHNQVTTKENCATNDPRTLWKIE